MVLALAFTHDSFDIEKLWIAAARFWTRVDKRTSDECWEWTGAKMTAGYGELSFLGRKLGAHRFSFLLHNGDLLPGKVVCHLCNNRACVNPGHLYQGSYRDNWEDCVRALRPEPTAEPEPVTAEEDDFWSFAASGSWPAAKDTGP